jgi:hypothetical protein
MLITLLGNIRMVYLQSLLLVSKSNNMKKELEKSVILISQVMASPTLSPVDMQKLEIVLGLLQGLLILETIKDPIL